MGGLNIRRFLHSSIVAPTLQTLSLAAAAFTQGAAAGTIIGAIQGKAPGSTLSINPADGRVAIDGSNNLVVGSTVASLGSFNVTIRETLSGATNTPKDTVVTVTVNAAVVTLQALALSNASFSQGAAAGTVIGAITGKTAGSTLSITPNDGRVTIDGSNNLIVGLTAASVGTFDVTVRETLAGATNTPHDNVFTITVNAVVTPPSYVTPGASIVGGTAWSADTYSTVEGTSTQEGYNYAPAGCAWATDRYLESVGTAAVAIGMVGAGTPDIASKDALDVFCNMKKFQVSVGNGPWFDVTTPTIDPTTGKLAYYAYVRASDAPVSGLYEVRSRAIPKVGKPFLMQGADTGISGNYLAYASAASHYVVLDKGDLPRITLYKKPDNDAGAAADSSNNGLTSSTPVYTWKTIRSKIRAHPSYPNVIATVYLLASQDHEWGRADVDETTLATGQQVVESNIGWTRILPAPGLTAADVKINRDKGFRIPFRKLFLKGFTLGEVCIDNTNPNDNYLHIHTEALVSGRTATSGVLDASFTVPVTTASSSVDGFGVTTAATDGDPAGFLSAPYTQYSIFNAGPNVAYAKFSNNSPSTAQITDTAIAVGGSVTMTPGDFLNVVTQTGTATLTVVGLNPQYKQPTNAAWIKYAYGANEHVNETISWAMGSPLFNSTYVRDVVLDHIANIGDVADNSKYIANLRIKNFVHGVSFNHLDALQCIHVGQGPLNHRWWEDVTAVAADNYYGQFLFSDNTETYENSVYLRLKCRVDNHALSFMLPVQNSRFLYLDLSGSMQVPTPAWVDGSQPLYNAPGGNNYFIFGAATGLGAMSWERFYQRGKKLLYPWTTTMPNPGYALATSALASAFGSVDVLEILDMDAQEFVDRINHDSADPPNYFSGGATKLRGLANVTRGELDQRTQWGDDFQNDSDGQIDQGLVAAQPAIVTGTHLSAQFNGVKSNTTGSFLNGYHMHQAIFRGAMSGNTLTVSQFGASKPLKVGSYIFGSGVPAGTKITALGTGTGGLGTYTVNTSATADGIWKAEYLGVNTPGAIAMVVDIGADSSTSNSYLFQKGWTNPEGTYIGYVFTGGVQQLVVGCGQTDGSNTVGISVLSGAAAPSILGPTVILFEMLSDRIRLTYWNAATGSGGYAVEKTFASNDAAKLTLQHSLTPGAPYSLGKHSVTAATQNALFKFYAKTESAALDTTTKANVVAALKARIGIA